MASSGNEKQRGNEIGATGRTVAANVRRVRRAAEITQAELSARLGAMGHPIPVASIGKLEAGDRRIEVDDLVALAVALNVSPMALLMPYTREPWDGAELTGARSDAYHVWSWGVGVAPLDVTSAGDVEDFNAAVGQFQHRSLPWWLRVDTHPIADNSRESGFSRRFWDREVARANEPEQPNG